jgi:predicted MFS family arabinose efflux permease
MVACTMGGMLNGASGWGMTAVALGAAGLILVVAMVLTTREPRRGGSEAQSVDVRPHDLDDTIGYLWRLRSRRFLAAGASLEIFATSAKLAWSAPFMIRAHHVNTGEAGAWLVTTTGVSGVAGMRFN